jgi:hypothetical protein
MIRGKLFVIIGAGVLLISILTFVLTSSKQPSSKELHGTSVVVLVDFSKSFAAMQRSNNSILYGLQNEDQRALKAVAGAVAELASLYWKPPLKTVWTQIQTSSISMKPLCDPLETLQILIKPEGSVGTREEIDSVLSKCAKSVIETSRDVRSLSDFTDISGAVAMASEIAPAGYNEKVIIILSDFHEELPRGTHEAAFRLNGERIVLLHRPGTDEPQNIDRYMNRIDEWKKKFKEHGASTVVALPVFTVTETRLRSALHPTNDNLGTALTVLVDFKDNVSTAIEGSTSDKGILVRIGQTLAELARDWQPPVTTLWVAIGSSGFASRTLPPVEFFPRLIKKPGELSRVEEFEMAMEELARALPSLGKSTISTDISGSLALACAVEPSPESHILIVISDFVDSGSWPAATHFRLSPKTRVIMVHIASREDRIDPNRYPARRQIWEQRFREAGAVEVYQFPLLSFTQNDLRSCLGDGN